MSAPQPTTGSLSISQRARAASMPEAAYLQGLNPEQREAAETLDGPLLVLSGAGTGKTTVLTARLAHLLATGRAQPWQLLAVTFTNKAAREMRTRTARLIGPAAEGMRWVGTFHSISAQMLRRHAELVGLKSSFTILDDDDQLRLLKQVIEAAGIDRKRWSPRFLQSMIDGWKNRALGPDKVSVQDGWAFADGRGAELYGVYQERLKTLNACDFGDLLLHMVAIFRTHPDVLAEWQGRFRYMLVDEYQDTNVAQYLWLRLLAQGTSNICVVGDDDQSIYGWRGAEVDNILRFERDFPGAKVVRLERNYRSTRHILDAASRLISGNTTRLGKTLWTEQQGGERVVVRGIWDGEAEARFVAGEIEACRRGGRAWSDHAVLVRASWQMRAFEERFIMLGLPYRVVGGPRFFERAEIRDAQAYLRLIRSEDDDLAFERVVNQPRRGVGDTTLQKLQVMARERGVSLARIAQDAAVADQVRGPAPAGLVRFLADLDRWRARAAEIRHTELMEAILEESGYVDMLKMDKSPQSQGRLENLKELVQAMAAFDSLAAWLEHVELVMDVERSESDDAVTICTLHAAKGLEWPVVFLPGWEEGVFPSQRALDETGAKGLEEERRLGYVGLTRAREKAVVSFVANRQIYGRWTSVIPSRFVDELPEDAVEVASDTGYGTSAAQQMGLAGFDPPGTGSVAAFDAGYSSPGWRRSQDARAAGRNPRTAPTIDGDARLVASETGGSGLRPGQRVFHEKFGYGTIRAADGSKLTVAFSTGEKKVVDSFVRRAD
jgi:DNA helicase-2/ATP-dependent DNA helicase PcrA